MTIQNAIRSWAEKRPAITRFAIERFANNKSIIELGDTKVTVGHPQVLDVLSRSEDFHLADSVRPRLMSGPFLLSTEPPGAYDVDKSVLCKAVYHDGEVIRLIREEVADQTRAKLRQANTRKRINVVADLLEPIATLVAQKFIIGPDQATQSDPCLQSALRTLAKLIIATDANDKRLRKDAAHATQYVENLVVERLRSAQPGDFDASAKLHHQGVPDSDIPRLVVGLAATATATIARAGGQALNQLLYRPREIQSAVGFAQNEDKSTVLQFVFEALRFDPMFYFIPRTAVRDTTIITDHKTVSVRAADKLIVGLLPAMFDSKGFAEPNRFLLNRPKDSYLHFGYGHHRCFGSIIAEAQLQEVFVQLLALEKIQRVSGRDGQLGHDGLAVTDLSVEWNRQ